MKENRTIVMRGTADSFCDSCNKDGKVLYYSLGASKIIHALCAECMIKKWDNTELPKIDVKGASK